jgi:hypothetical protein
MDQLQRLEERENGIPAEVRAYLARAIPRRTGEDNHTLIIGLGAVFKYRNSREALKLRLGLEGQALADADWFLDAVVE